MFSDYFSNASCSVTESVVSFGKGVGDGEFLIEFTKTLVVDDEECVDVAADFLYSVE